MSNKTHHDQKGMSSFGMQPQHGQLNANMAQQSTKTRLKGQACLFDVRGSKLGTRPTLQWAQARLAAC